MLCLATDHFTVVNEGVLDLSEVISILMSHVSVLEMELSKTSDCH